MQGDDSKRPPEAPESDTKKPTAREAELGAQKPAKRAFTTTSAPSLELPKGGGAIRGIGETFKVNPATGTASFSLPLPISPAPRGPTPELALSYDSGSGNGVFGIGWSLSLPQISRKTDKKIPQYLDSQDSDVFLLSGAEDLVPMVGVPIIDDANERRERYRPRVEGLFSVIEKIFTKTTKELWWRATTRDNVTSTFGRTSASRIEDPGQATSEKPKRIFAWLLDKTEDNLGNVVEYFYDAENGAGSPLGKPSEKHRKSGGLAKFTNQYLKRVTYGNTTMGAGNTRKFEVVFDYGEHSATAPTPTDAGPKYVRKDIFSSYRPGFEVRTYRLCKRILMFHDFSEITPRPPTGPTLVKSLDLVYSESHRMTKLASATLKGYTWNGTSYDAKAMPPVTFGYSPDAFSKSVKDVAKADLGDDFPRFAFGSAAQWVDLDSEGIPGVLVQQSRSHRYKRNLGSGKLSGGRTLTTGPAISEGPHQLVDVAGAGTLAMVSLQGAQPGFQERVGDGWGPFVPFRSFPRVDFDDPNTRLMDINGDGFEDIVVTRGDHIEWYPSLGRDGYGPARKVPLPTDQEQGPRIVFADLLATVMVADMNGDGMADLVRVTESGVTYWPNLGYGRFGAAVQMDNAPFLENRARFDARRVRLADLDGTGTADLLYFTADGLRVFRNQSGNSFVEEGTFMVPPEAVGGSILDLFGTGTSCVFWSPRTNAEYPYGRYWDPLLSKKPHLLTDIDNHAGRLVHFNYAPSTKHYLADRKAGRIWPTKLPFPVQIVESVETYDAVSRTRLTSSYTYHHGHYDTQEREFRGFGYVEQLDAERFGAEHGQGSFPNYPPPINGEVPQNPILTKTWFHTGAWRERADQKAAYEKDYWAGDAALASVPHLECALPTGLTPQELREGWRALRGSMIRQEVFELDNTALASIPYSVSEKNYDVRKLQAPQKARGAEYPDLSAVFHTVERESRSWAYERVANDPRVSQTLALTVDAFGIVTQSAAIAYKRRTAAHPEQDVFRCVITEQTVVHFDNLSTGHRIGIPTESRAYELTDSSKPAAFLSLETVQTNFTNASLIPYEQTGGSGIQKRLIQREKARYYDSTALPAGLLNFGVADPKALLFKSYLLDLTDALNTAVFGPKASTAQLAPILTEGGYVTPAGETGYWLPSGHVVFDATKFYLPTSAVDSFGNTSTIAYDAYNMFALSVTDALGNVVASTHDYRVLAPRLITDPNGNRQEAAYDKLGMIEAVAVMGKTTESLGDTIANPTMKWEYDYTRWDSQQKPNFIHTFARKVHQGTPSWQETYVYSDGSGRVVMTKVQAEPGDAPQRDVNGNLIVPIVQVPTNPRWVGSGRTVVNNKGNPVKQYEPYFSSLFEYETEAELVQTGVTPVITYDGLGRVLRTDFPDGSYSRVERPSAWLERAYDRNDTVGETGNLWAAKRDPLITPSASAEDQRALLITQPHANTPTQTHSDVMGRPFLVVAHNKIGAADQFLETRTKLDIEGQVLEVKDPLIRTCQTNAYSMAGMLLKDSNIDKGARWYLGDVNGAPLRRWDDRDQVFRSTYDVLRRPTHLHMKPGAGTELLLERMVYGDSAGTGIPDPKVGNLRGKMIRHFDGAGRIKAESYDFKGNSLTSDRRLATNYTSTVDWSALNAITNVATLDSTAAGALETEFFTETRAFDALNRITSLITPDTSEYLPVYNEASLLNAVNVKVRGVSPAKNFVANIDYDAKGQRKKIEYSDLGSGARFTTDYTYDKLTFRLTKLKTTRTSPADALQELSYWFDPSGNIVQVSDAAQQDLFYADAYVAPDNLFVYDAVYRLVQSSGREHWSIGDVMVDNNDQPIRNLPLGSDPQAMRNYTENYSFDVVGNLLSMQHVAGAASWTRNYTYTAGTNRLATTSGGATYTHDFHGNMTVMPHLPAITYSPFDQMASALRLGDAGTVYFTYDSSGQRVRKVWEETASIKHDRIYLGSYEIFRKRVSGTVNLERHTLHVMDGVQRIAMVETKTIDTSAPGSTGIDMYRYQLGNHLGSAIVEVDETGAVFSYEELHPYGTSAYRAASSTVDVSARRYRYAGKERDEETSLYYNGARYLAAWLGRWTSADPIGMHAGVNLYQYCRGSPINYTDPSGTDEELTWARPAKPAAHGRSILSAPPAMDTGITPKERDQRIRDAGERLQGAGDVLSESWEVFRNTFNPMGPEEGKPTIPGAVWANMKQKYNDAGGGRLGVRDAINTLNPLVSLYEETRAGFKAAENGDQRAVGRHQLGALTSLFSFLGLWNGAAGGTVRPGPALATNEGLVLATDSVAASGGPTAGLFGAGVAIMAGDDDPPGGSSESVPKTDDAADAAAAEEEAGLVVPKSPAELLTPGGTRIGVAGASKDLRVLTGGAAAAKDLFDQLAIGGTAVPGYPGTGVKLPSGGFVGLRSIATGTGGRAAPVMTIDVKIPGINIREIKFLP